MTAGGFSVHPPTLVASSKNADVVTGSVLASAGQLTGQTTKAVAAHRGWQSSPSLHACLDAWRTQLRVLAREIHEISVSLNASAEHYNLAEQKVLHELNQVAAQVPLDDASDE